ncbi:MAG: GNAT family N-acetyltransferase [Vulcanimicrobiaceae bacterium]
MGESGNDRTGDLHDAGYLPLRLATIDDVEELVRHRAEMFAEMGTPRDLRFAVMLANSKRWFREHITNGTYLGFLIAARDGNVAAGGGLYIYDWFPTHRDTGVRRGYILNVYVDADHRRRGLARKVTEACLDACRERGIEVVTLHASKAGRSIYERLGFASTSEMRLSLTGL